VKRYQTYHLHYDSPRSLQPCYGRRVLELRKTFPELASPCNFSDFVLNFPSFQDVSVDFATADNRIFRNLSLVLTGDQVLLLLKAVRTFPREQIYNSIDEHRRNSRMTPSLPVEPGIMLTTRLLPVLHPCDFSLLTECLTQSLATSSAIDSMLQERLSKRHDNIAMPKLFPPEIYDCGSPFLPTTPTCTGKHFCIACDISFTNSEALKKHQTEFCERKLDWICPTCPDQTFGLLDRLNRHHRKAHAGTCPHDCDKRKTYPSDHCKAALLQCYRTAPEKEAWGCPCCIKLLRYS
jgi:hypothetical protein